MPSRAYTIVLVRLREVLLSVGAQVFSCLQILTQSMAEYTRKEYATPVWNILLVSRGL